MYISSIAAINNFSPSGVHTRICDQLSIVYNSWWHTGFWEKKVKICHFFNVCALKFRLKIKVDTCIYIFLTKIIFLEIQNKRDFFRIINLVVILHIFGFDIIFKIFLFKLCNMSNSHRTQFFLNEKI